MREPVRVVLGPTYLPTLWDLRKRVSAARNAGEAVVFIQLSTPINSELVDLAILSSDLYLIGARGRAGVWLEFAPDDQQAGQSGAHRTAKAETTRIPVGKGGCPAGAGELSCIPAAMVAPG
jgi:hypothetical protein